MNQSNIKPGYVLRDPGLIFESHIGSGGEAEIWQVKELQFSKRRLAAKVICMPFENRVEHENIKRRRRIQEQEVLCWNKVCQGNHIVQYLGPIDTVQELDEVPHLFLGFTMQLSELGDLKKYITNDQLKLTGRKELRNFLLNIAAGVLYAHEQDVAHQDIKPENVLLFQEGLSLDPRIMDFGMAITTDIDYQVGGTPEYMAPERFERGKAFSIDEAKRSDVYSLGVLFYEIICGRLPFRINATTEESRWDQCKHWHVNEKFDGVELEKMVGRPLTEVIVGMLNREPVKRLDLIRVIRNLERQGEESIVFHSTTTESFSVVSSDRYRWNPALHRLLGNDLHFAFIRCESPTADVKWLIANLSQHKLHGYSLYRVLGGYDYLLRIWLKNTHRDALDEVFNQMQLSISAKLLRLDVKAMDIFKSTKPLVIGSPKEALELICECRKEASPEDETRCLIDRGLVSSVLEVPRGHSIRFFITVRATAVINDWAKTALSRQFIDLLRREKRVKQASVYSGVGDFAILLKFRLEIFAYFKDVLIALMRSAELAKKDGFNLSFQTFVEWDVKPYQESDDGSIIKEASLVYKQLV